MTEIIPTMRVLPAQQMRFALHFLAQTGISLDALLRGTGIAPADIDGTDFVFRERALWPLCTNLAAHFGADWYLRNPLLWGPELQSEVGLAVRYARNLGEGIQTIVDLIGQRWPMLALQQRAANGCLLLEGRRTESIPAEHWQMVTVFAALNFQSATASFLNGDKVRLHYRFDSPTPRYHAVVSELLKGQIVWNAPVASVEVPETLLDRVSPLSNAASYATIIDALHRSSERAGREASIAGRVTVILDGVSQGQKKAEEVAATLGMTRRTLERKLAGEGASFGVLAETALKYRLERLLTDGHRSPDVLAGIMGYHDGSSLTRACKRWYGVSLSAVRERILTQR
jgi:AraC-like DNA-binding protein